MKNIEKSFWCMLGIGAFIALIYIIMVLEGF